MNYEVSCDVENSTFRIFNFRQVVWNHFSGKVKNFIILFTKLPWEYNIETILKSSLYLL